MTITRATPSDGGATGRLRVGRRTFLDAVLGVGFISTLLAIAYPIWRYLNPPARGEPATTSASAGPLADLPPNSGTLIGFGAIPVLVIRTPEGALRAFNGICTHLDCTVQYRTDTSQIWCACHNGLFDLEGQVISGPPPRPLEPLTVNVRGERGSEEIVVSRS